MANDVTNNPWVLDTAATITTDKVRVEKLIWEGGGAGMAATLQHSSGVNFWSATSVAGERVTEDFDGQAGDVDGFVLATLDGGTLYVHFA